ncbi:MAG: NAD(P)-dependent oxidoreductase [Planctomycetota bacterium]|nr:NAD(P)-dependent oxidoreductase [Planctomycetota bacterium]
MNSVATVARPAVVTGCTGEIGNALAGLLLERGVEVYALCRPRSWRLQFLPSSPRLHFVERDIFSLDGVEEAIGKPCGAFFHLGWHASYGPERTNPRGQVRNVSAALDAVALAMRLGCSVFVGAGSLSQYGSVEETIAPETPMQPVTAYGVAKLCAEQMTRLLAADFGLRHVWGRVLSVYGPCDGPFTLISSLMRARLRGEELPITPCGQLWDFLYARDAARAFLAMAERGGNGKAYCVASGACRPLREFVADFAALPGGTVKIRFGGMPYAQNQRMRLQGDISALAADTGFAPATPFAEGIARTWRWYQEHPEAAALPEGDAT